MAVVVALLRAVNVAGHGRLPMADLRRIAADAGLGDPRTHLQSGNLLVRTEGDADGVAAILEAAIREDLGSSVAVLTRTAAEWEAVVASNPFEEEARVDPRTVHVTFLPTDGAAALGGLDAEAFAPERARALGRELYMSLPEGIGRSRLATTLSRREPMASGTTRNWRTVLALAEMLAE